MPRTSSSTISQCVTDSAAQQDTARYDETFLAETHGSDLSVKLQRNMPLPASLDAVAEELDSLMDEMTAFINQKTGEITSVSNDDAALVEGETDGQDLPDWQIEMLPKLREILFGEEWIALPTKFDIHEWEIMRKFADSVDDETLGSRLHHTIRGKGAFRMFRSTVEDAGLREEWYGFKRQVLRQIAKDALDQHRIPYR